MLFLFPLSGGAKTELVSKKEVSALADLFEIPGLQKYISESLKEKLTYQLSNRMAQWAAEELHALLHPKKKPEKREKSKEVQDKQALEAAVQKALQKRIAKWLPQAAWKLLHEEIYYKRVVGKENLEDFKKIEKEADDLFSKSLNKQIDRWGGELYEKIIDEVAEKAGMHSLKKIQSDFLDRMRGKFPAQGLAALEKGREHFEKYVDQVHAHLPAAYFLRLKKEWTGIYVTDLPNRIYGGVLAASAAMHIAKAFSGPQVNLYELKRAKEVTVTLVWQLKNREYVSLNIGDFIQITGGLEKQLGSFHWGNLDKIKKWGPSTQLIKRLRQIEAELKKIDKTADEKIFNKIREEFEKISKDLLKPLTFRLPCLTPEACPEFGGEIPNPFRWKGMKKILGKENGLLGKAGDFSFRKEFKKYLKTSGIEKKLKKANADAAKGLSKAALALAKATKLTGPLAEILDIEKIPYKKRSNKSDFDPVFLHNGEYYAEITDAAFTSGPIPLRFTRNYHSRARFLGELGWNWSHNFAEKLLFWKEGGEFGRTYITPKGEKYFFKEEGFNFNASPGLPLTLKRMEGKLHLTDEKGMLHVFDAEGKLLRLEKEGTVLQCDYDREGRLSSVTDTGGGKEFRFYYNEAGLLETLEDGGKRRWHFEYDDNLDLAAVVSPPTIRFPRERTVRYAYDNHQLILAMDPKGRIYLQNFYEVLSGKQFGRGKVTAQIYGEEEGVIEARYDGRHTWVNDRSGCFFLYEHGERGELIGEYFVTEAGEKIHLPPAADLSSITADDVSPSDEGKEGRYFYDANDNLTRAEMPDRGLTFDYEYDILDRPVAEQVTFNGEKKITTQYRYDSAGNLKEIIDPLGNRQSMDTLQQPLTLPYPRFYREEEVFVERDPYGRPLRVGKTGMEWDDNGRLISLTDEEGAKTTYRYDRRNRLVAEIFPNRSTQFYQYDEKGNIIAVKNRGETLIRYRYDKKGRILERNGSDCNEAYRYNENGDLARAVGEGEGGERVRVDFSYDAKGRLTGEAINGTWVLKSFDGHGIKTALRYPSGLLAIRHYKGEKLKEVYVNGRPVPVFPRIQTNIEEESEKEKEVRDRGGRLAGERNLKYEYDSFNRLSKVIDAQGNLLRRIFYDPLDRPVHVLLPQEGRRLSYFYDGWQRIAVRESGAFREYIFGDSLDRILALHDGGANTMRFYRLDERGGVAEIINEEGTPVETYTYTPFGRVSIAGPQGNKLTASRVGNDLGFMGRPFDPLTGLVQMRYRYYSPALREFLTPDPLGYKNDFYAPSFWKLEAAPSFHRGQGEATGSTFPQGISKGRGFVMGDPLPVSVPEMNLFAYAGGDPLHSYDPFGLSPMPIPPFGEKGKAENHLEILAAGNRLSLALFSLPPSMPANRTCGE